MITNGTRTHYNAIFEVRFERSVVIKWEEKIEENGARIKNLLEVSK